MLTVWLIALLAPACTPLLAAGPDLTASTSHWAFRAIQPPVVPDTRSGWAQSPIDQFILEQLRAQKLRPAKPASRELLLRRACFDLIGLPPTPLEIETFVADKSPEAWSKVVDRLLASPRYGERWARHWLDVVRYAESDGFEHDAVRPNTWRYRDYVIQSFNEDKPYDRFVQEQVAGDERWPNDPAAVVATAFNLLGPDMVDSADQVQRRLLTLSDMTDTTATAFLGLTLGCARCHDHKLEPLSQVDYYSLQAFFASAQFHRELAVPTAEERKQHEVGMAAYNARAGDYQRQLSAIEQPLREKLRTEKLDQMSEDVQLAHRTPREKRTPEQQSSVLETDPQLLVTDAEVTKAILPADKTRRSKILAELKKIPKPAPLPLTLALRNTNGPGPVTKVLARGDYNNPGETVRPNFPAILAIQRDREPRPRPVPAAARQVAGDETGGPRWPLAAWLTSPSNPLTARVLVNRVWQHHFGHGLVATPNDFGTRGARPTHPELLDWLSAEFMSRGWSLKALHRLILNSATYQMSSETDANASKLDPENRWLSHQNRVRLEGEALRDSLLFISGQLNLRLGGPSVLPPIAADIVKTSRNWSASADPAEHQRRSIYIFARRNLRFPFLEVFDAPDSNLSCAERGQSTTAPQSLTLLNSREVVTASRATAQRVLQEASPDSARVELAFRLILGRKPERTERREALEFLSAARARSTPPETSGAAAGATAAPEAPGLEWTELCRALFNLNDFVYVD